MYKPTIQWLLEHRKSSSEIINDLIELKRMLPNNNLYGIRNKTTNRFITVGKLNGEILYGIDCNIKFAYIRNNKENVKSVYNILSQDKDFKNDNFVDVLTDKEIKEYLRG